MKQDLSVPEALRLAGELEQLDRLQDAENIYRGILDADRHEPEALNRLGALRFGKGDIYQALYLFDRAVKTKKRYAAALANRGAARAQLGDFKEAEADLRLATHIEPGNVIAWNNLGNTFERMDLLFDALEALDRCLALDPFHAISHFNRGTILSRLGRFGEAVLAFDGAMRAGGQIEADAHYNRAIARLALGDLAAFSEYEWRFKSSERIYRMPSKAPAWKGEALDGKTILLWGEQGMGDTIQFLRYVDTVGTSARVLLFVHTALRELCRWHFGGRVTVLDSDKDLPPHDFQCPLMSLPTILGTEIPMAWRPHKNLFGCNQWGGRIGSNLTRAPALRVGVCWAGNPAHRNDRNRSMSGDDVAKLLGVPGVEYFSLQVGAPPVPGIRDLASHLTDMNQTAHAIGCLDIVISVDTAVAHLAASVGTETLVLLPKVADWRWGQAGTKTPWYPDATLFRQSSPGHWLGVVADVRRWLANRARQAA